MGGVDAGGGITGSVGGASESSAGEAGSASSGSGGVEMGGASDGVAGNGINGDVFNGGLAGKDKGERTRSLSSSKSVRSSTSLRRFLVFFFRQREAVV